MDPICGRWVADAAVLYLLDKTDDDQETCLRLGIRHKPLKLLEEIPKAVEFARTELADNPSCQLAQRVVMLIRIPIGVAEELAQHVGKCRAGLHQTFHSVVFANHVTTSSPRGSAQRQSDAATITP